jgi:AbiTii
VAEGLIAEIQREAIDSEASVSSLLRKVKLAAAKLKLETLASWVDLELNGYPTREVPAYRRFSGQPRYWNEYHGWQPLGGDPTIIGKLADVTFSDSMASIEALVARKSGSLLSQFPPGILDALSKGMGINVAQAGTEISTAKAVGVLDAVRTAVLDWAIEMEKAGVHGEGLSFSPAEQEIAQSASNVFNIGTIGTFTGNLGTGNFSGDITSAPLNVEKVKNLVAQIKSQSESLANEGVETTALTSALEKIEGHLAKADETLLRKALGELQSILTKAAGGLVSTGALTLLHHILGTGVPG